MHEVPFVHRCVLGLAALVLMAGIVTFGVRAALGAYADVYTITAEFPRTGQGLDESATVKIRGVTIGNVDRIRLLDDGRVEVRLEIQDGVRVPDTVSASSEPLSVFGPKFIKLTPGDHEGVGPFLRDGDRISNTAAPTELTEILARASRLLDVVDPTELSTVLHTLAEGVSGLGPELGRTVDSAGVLVQHLEQRSGDVRQLLTDLALLSGDLGSRGDEFVGVARDLETVLAEVASHPRETADLLDSAGRLASDLADVVAGHQPALDALLGGLSPAVAAIYDQLALVDDFLQANNPLIETLGENLFRYHLPDGHIVGVLKGGIPLDVCEILIGIPGCVY